MSDDVGGPQDVGQGFQWIDVGSTLMTPLTQLLSENVQPGSDLSYQTCKNIRLWHPLGEKIVSEPIQIAQSQERVITVPKGPEERVVEAFNAEWKRLGCMGSIFNTMASARCYGVSAVVMVAKDVDSNAPIDPFDLPKHRIVFNMADPLNTAGSLVLDQNPNAMEFQRALDVKVSGKQYHPSRALVVMNEHPVYIAYNSPGFGFNGRSAYQRALFPLKSFVQSMFTDDMVTTKAGLLIAKMKQPGSIVSRTMQLAFGLKRQMLQGGRTGNVLSIAAPDEEITTLNMQNTDNAMTTARKNILENIAAAVPMPAQLLNSETYAEGFGEGTEDAKKVAKYIDRVRIEMQPLYDWFDNIVMYRAWTPAFYETIQAEFPDYKSVDFKTAFYEWKNSFHVEWPSLITEPPSEEVKTEDVKLKGIIALLEVLLPEADPDNKARLIQAALDNVNENKLMFTTPFEFDAKALIEYLNTKAAQEAEAMEPEAPATFSNRA